MREPLGYCYPPVEAVNDALVSVGQGVVALVSSWNTELLETRVEEDPDIHGGGLPGSTVASIGEDAGKDLSHHAGTQVLKNKVCT